MAVEEETILQETLVEAGVLVELFIIHHIQFLQELYTQLMSGAVVLEQLVMLRELSGQIPHLLLRVEQLLLKVEVLVRSSPAPAAVVVLVVAPAAGVQQLQELQHNQVKHNQYQDLFSMDMLEEQVQDQIVEYLLAAAVPVAQAALVDLVVPVA